MTIENPSIAALMPENGRSEHLDSLIRRWKAGEATNGMMTGEEVDELDKAVEDGLVTQEELMESSNAA